MMREYVIIADSTNDMPPEFAMENNVDIVKIIYQLDDEVYGIDKHLSMKEFYDEMRAGRMTKTAAPNIHQIKEHFEKWAKEGKDILFMCLSSGISSTVNNAFIARDEVAEEYPDVDICVMDSICCAGGQGMLLYHAVNNKKNGMSARENMESLEEIKHHIIQKFTVDDLTYLQRGGMISKAAAAIGTVINLKPLLHVDAEGKLGAEQKIRGRKKALNQLIENMGPAMGSYIDKQEMILVCHGDCDEDVDYCIKLIEEKYKPKEIIKSYISPTIGAHTGPGGLAIFFMGDNR